jgi:excisionase family DNA binding protein
VIEQPDGCRVLLPARMTESFAATLPMVEGPRLALDSLRELRGTVDALVVSSSSSSKTIRTGGDGDGVKRATATTRSVVTHNKRNSAAAARSHSSRRDRKSTQAADKRMQRPAASKGDTWTQQPVRAFRKDHDIAMYRVGERSERGELILHEAAGRLGVSKITVVRLIKDGVLPAKQSCVGAPYVIRETDLDLREVRIQRTVVQYHKIRDREALIINDVERCASCNQPAKPRE